MSSACFAHLMLLFGSAYRDARPRDRWQSVLSFQTGDAVRVDSADPPVLAYGNVYGHGGAASTGMADPTGSDGWELLHGLDTASDDRAADTDGAGLTHEQEFAVGCFPERADTDGDGIDDGTEVAASTDPLDPTDSARSHRLVGGHRVEPVVRRAPRGPPRVDQASRRAAHRDRRGAMRASTLLLLLAACTGDSGDTAVIEPACLDGWADGVTGADDTPTTQLHAAVAADEGGLFATWNRGDGADGFDVWLARYGCAGAVTWGPVQSTESADNEIDPAIAVSGDRVLVAWASDNGSGANNLDIRYRVYDRDGAPITGAIELAASRSGVPVTGNATQPTLAATAEGWVLAGSWGHSDAPAFQVFAVELDRDGNLLGEAEDGELDTVFGQLYASVAHADGETWLVWEEESVDSTDPVVAGGPLGGSTAVLADPARTPDVAFGPGGVWRAWSNNAQEIVLSLPDGAEIPLTGEGALISPALAPTADGMIVAGLEQLGGLEATVVIWRLDAAGNTLSTRRLAMPAILYYGAEIAALDGTHAAVSYTAGTYPDLRATLERVTLD